MSRYRRRKRIYIDFMLWFMVAVFVASLLLFLFEATGLLYKVNISAEMLYFYEYYITVAIGKWIGHTADTINFFKFFLLLFELVLIVFAAILDTVLFIILFVVFFIIMILMAILHFGYLLIIPLGVAFFGFMNIVAQYKNDDVGFDESNTLQKIIMTVLYALSIAMLTHYLVHTILLLIDIYSK